MSRQSTTVSVFLASPSDVQHERDLISDIAGRWNMRHGRTKAVFIELLRYETSVSAGFGDDGQSVINEQIGDDYDALIAVFWNRIGTATDRSASGSVEEIEKAIARFKSDGNVEVAVYFKQAAANVDSLDLQQVQGIRDLKKRLETEGSLHKPFSNDGQLTYEIEMLFDRLARRFSSGETKKKAKSLSQSSSSAISDNANSSPSDSDEPGLLDVMEALEKHANETSAFTSELGDRLGELADKTSAQTSLIEDAARLGPLQATDVKPTIAVISSAMDSFSEFVELGIENYKESTLGVGHDIRLIVDLSSDFDQSDDDKKETVSTIFNLISSSKDGLEGLNGLATTTSSLPRMTTLFNKSRKRLLNNLQLVQDEIFNLIQMLDSSLTTLIGDENKFTLTCNSGDTIPIS